MPHDQREIRRKLRILGPAGLTNKRSVQRNHPNRTPPAVAEKVPQLRQIVCFQ